jgi:hypothetical protein
MPNDVKDTCMKCGAFITDDKPLDYIMCSKLFNPERARAIQTWCCDLCEDCEKDLIEWLGAVRY